MYISSVFNMYINELKFIYNKAHTTKLKFNGNKCEIYGRYGINYQHY